MFGLNRTPSIAPGEVHSRLLHQAPGPLFGQEGGQTRH